MTTTTQLLEALERITREEFEIAKDKKAIDKAMNTKIGRCQEQRRAILEEIDALNAGRSDYLPFTDRDWASGEKEETRDENV